jgi:hypothetical protein
MRRRSKIALVVLFAPFVLVALCYGGRTVFGTPAEPQHEYGNRLEKTKWDRHAFKSAEFCKGCHQEIYDQWKESYLSKSFDSSVKELALHRLTLQLRGIDEDEIRFCIECHAPLALASPEDLNIEDPLSREGVTCTVCHSAVESHVNTNPAHIDWDPGGPMSGPFDDAVSPIHATAKTELYTDRKDRLCGSCHYSAWPRSGMPIDWTYEEWKEAGQPDDKNCVDCHMPEYTGRAAELPEVPERKLRKHTFVGGHDPETVLGSALLEITPTYEAGRTSLRIGVANQAGHNHPSGNPPAPELRLTVALVAGERTEVVYGQTYRFDYVLESGAPTYDVTIAHAIGNDTSLRPYETRMEEVEIVHDDLASHWREARDAKVEVDLEFSYWRPYEPSMRWNSYTSTVYQHLSNRDVDLVTFLRTFTRQSTWLALYDAIGSSKGDPLPVDAKTVPLFEPPGGAAPPQE